MNDAPVTIISPADSIRFATELSKTGLVHNNSILNELLKALTAPALQWLQTINNSQIITLTTAERYRQSLRESECGQKKQLNLPR